MGPDDMRYFNMVAKGMADGLSFHSLRHTHATMLLENGEDLELVSKRLGHSSVELTARTYSHVLEKRKAQTIKRLNEIL
jgi:integrase